LTGAWLFGALMEAVWRLFRAPGDPPMTRFLAAQLGTSHYFNICRARRDFGYAPAISTAEGMECLAADLAARGLIDAETRRCGDAKRQEGRGEKGEGRSADAGTRRKEP
jgi:hypothetical protein